MQEQEQKCTCAAAPTLIFACSGASDVGEITDRCARRLTKEGIGKMCCLAGIGGRVEEIFLNTEAAQTILAIDGCKQDCAKRTLEHAGFKNFRHLRLSDFGFEKGKTPPTGGKIDEAVEKAKELL